MTIPQHAIAGLWPALLTPIHTDGSIDIPRMIAHGQHLLSSGSDGLTLFGTTGEGTSFTVQQRMAAADAFVAAGVMGDQLVINLTALARDDAVALGVHAVKIKAKAGLLMPPFYYNGQHDAGLVNYIGEVIDEVCAHAGHCLPIILYHFPGLSGVGWSVSAIAQLMQKHPQQVVSIKDSSADVAHSKMLAQTFPKLAVLVGCEPDVMPTQLVGGAGSICGLANIAPKLMRRMMDEPAHVSAADDKLMRDLLGLLSLQPGMPFVSAYKAMLAELTGDDAWLRVRTPLTALSAQQENAVRQGYRKLH
ncbi:dihydrodipicolinate synthase family protein [Variovorax sp. PCZ-1]|uniref:dihydrodipicolinate synthase family protein n=1 Tax=Variovorax sp. PCZ-1 TaxID=2835533 RepID=UPI001BCEEBB8|nr:dihydrodipicolinate synthase family protein [Variovorax sp. PCZ-1]MBS7806430.1 dihydrodipicolinate synthase family protein [Variovorax sp. PCZ-1]